MTTTQIVTVHYEELPSAAIACMLQESQHLTDTPGQCLRLELGNHDTQWMRACMMRVETRPCSGMSINGEWI